MCLSVCHLCLYPSLQSHCGSHLSPLPRRPNSVSDIYFAFVAKITVFAARRTQGHRKIKGDSCTSATSLLRGAAGKREENEAASFVYLFFTHLFPRTFCSVVQANCGSCVKEDIFWKNWQTLLVPVVSGPVPGRKACWHLCRKKQ